MDWIDCPSLTLVFRQTLLHYIKADRQTWLHARNDGCHSELRDGRQGAREEVCRAEDMRGEGAQCLHSGWDEERLNGVWRTLRASSTAGSILCTCAHFRKHGWEFLTLTTLHYTVQWVLLLSICYFGFPCCIFHLFPFTSFVAISFSAVLSLSSHVEILSMVLLFCLLK